MHPVIMQALAAEHIKSMMTAADKARLAHHARLARQRRVRRRQGHAGEHVTTAPPSKAEVPGPVELVSNR